jgi:MFS family permease
MRHLLGSRLPNTYEFELVIEMKQSGTIFYGWFIVGVGILAYALGYGGRYSFSVIFPSLLNEFSWPRDQAATILSFHLLVYGVTAPFAGSLVDKIGPRKTMVCGTLIFSLGLALSGYGKSPQHFFLSFGILSGAGLSLMGAVPFTTILRNWFERKRGLAFSLLFFGVGGAFACYPGIAFLVEKYGWSVAFFVEGFTVSGLMLPIIILIIRYHPREKGLVSDGNSKTACDSKIGLQKTEQIVGYDWASIDWTLGKAATTFRFWLLCISTFSMWGIAQHIMVTHHVAFAIDLGYSSVQVSSILSLFGVMFSLGSLAGFICDRIGRELTMTAAMLICLSGVLAIIIMEKNLSLWMLGYYAMAFGFGLGMTNPVIAAATTDIFQGPAVGTIIGFVWFSFAIGGTIGPWLGGWIFEFTGSYVVAFILAMIFCVVSCSALWLAAPRKARRLSDRVSLLSING